MQKGRKGREPALSRAKRFAHRRLGYHTGTAHHEELGHATLTQYSSIH